jgi:hypothetical protein
LFLSVVITFQRCHIRKLLIRLNFFISNIFHQFCKSIWVLLIPFTTLFFIMLSKTKKTTYRQQNQFLQ